MSRPKSFAPPRIHPGRWYFFTVVAAAGAVAGMTLSEQRLPAALLLLIATGSGIAARQAVRQQRIAEAATLFSLETEAAPRRKSY